MQVSRFLVTLFLLSFICCATYAQTQDESSASQVVGFQNLVKGQDFDAFVNSLHGVDPDTSIAKIKQRIASPAYQDSESQRGLHLLLAACQANAGLRQEAIKTAKFIKTKWSDKATLGLIGKLSLPDADRNDSSAKIKVNVEGANGDAAKAASLFISYVRLKTNAKQLEQLMPAYQSLLKSHAEDPAIIPAVMAYENAFERFDRQNEAYNVLKAFCDESKLAKMTPSVLSRLATVANFIRDKSSEALTLCDQSLSMNPSAHTKAEALLAKSAALRDLGRQQEGMQAILEAKKIAEANGYTEMLEVIGVVMQPHHSMGPDTVKQPVQKPTGAKNTSVFLAVLVASVGLIVFFMRRQRSSKTA